jgi:hypothetical protein
MDTRNQREPSAHSIAFHEEQLPLFDAYMTDELDEDERAQVEQHRQSCQECQQLFAGVAHLRHALGTLSETENPSVPAHARPHSSSMLQAVMARIEQGKNRGDHFTVDHASQAQTSFRTLRANSPAALSRKRVRSIYLSIAAAVFCVLLLGGLIITIRNASTSSGNRQISVPAPFVWTTQQPMLVQNSTGVFALKEIEVITAKELYFYYAFKSSHQGTIHVAAVSSLNAGQRPVPLSATVLSLGMIDDYSIGVIRVQYLNRVGQMIALSITSPKEGSVHWQVSPLKQLVAEPHPEGGTYYGFPIDQQIFPAIIWSGPRSGLVGPSQHSMVSLFKNAAGTRYIYLQVNYSGKFAVITKEQCIQLIGEQNCT